MTQETREQKMVLNSSEIKIHESKCLIFYPKSTPKIFFPPVALGVQLNIIHNMRD